MFSSLSSPTRKLIIIYFPKHKRNNCEDTRSWASWQKKYYGKKKKYIFSEDKKHKKTYSGIHYNYFHYLQLLKNNYDVTPPWASP